MAACFLTGYLPVSHLLSLSSLHHKRGIHLSEPSPALLDYSPAANGVGKRENFQRPNVYEHAEGCWSKEGAWRLWHCDTCSFVISAEWCSNYCHWGARFCVWDSAVEQRVMSMGKHSGGKCKVPGGTALLVLHIDNTLVM